jgi:hypothetical protein
MECIEAVEATQFCGGANGTLKPAATLAVSGLSFVLFGPSVEAILLKSTGTVWHRLASTGLPTTDVPPPSPTASSLDPAPVFVPPSLRGLQNSNTRDRHTLLPILLRIQFLIPLLSVQSIFIYLSYSPFSLDYRP